MIYFIFEKMFMLLRWIASYIDFDAIWAMIPFEYLEIIKVIIPDWKPETYIAISAMASVVIAGCALWVSMRSDKRREEQAELLSERNERQARLSNERREEQARISNERREKHARLSVLPLLSVLRTSTGVQKGLINIRAILINNGVGPAVIKNLVLLFKGKEKSRNDNKTYEEFLHNIEGFKCISTNHRTRNSVIAAGDELILWEIEYDPKIKSDKDLEGLRIHIDYYSIYKDELFTYPPKAKK